MQTYLSVEVLPSAQISKGSFDLPKVKIPFQVRFLVEGTDQVIRTISNLEINLTRTTVKGTEENGGKDTNLYDNTILLTGLQRDGEKVSRKITSFSNKNLVEGFKDENLEKFMKEHIVPVVEKFFIQEKAELTQE